MCSADSLIALIGGNRYGWFVQNEINDLPIDESYRTGATSTPDCLIKITNGGTFGSLFSTPIVNPPQSAILGMHTIKERAVVENGAVVAAPMMYVAISYDHRIIDGKDAVLFLVDIKNQLENPQRMLLGM